MGSLPQLSIVKGLQKSFKPRLLHKEFEEKVDKEFGEKPALIFKGEREQFCHTRSFFINYVAFQTKMEPSAGLTTTH